MGCRITAEVENGKIHSVEGYSCNIGKKYAQEELTTPKRMVTGFGACVRKQSSIAGQDFLSN
jgi:CxxC motif-containing protein